MRALTGRPVPRLPPKRRRVKFRGQTSSRSEGTRKADIRRGRAGTVLGGLKPRQPRGERAAKPRCLPACESVGKCSPYQAAADDTDYECLYTTAVGLGKTTMRPMQIAANAAETAHQLGRVFARRSARADCPPRRPTERASVRWWQRRGLRPGLLLRYSGRLHGAFCPEWREAGSPKFGKQTNNAPYPFHLTLYLYLLSPDLLQTPFLS